VGFLPSKVRARDGHPRHHCFEVGSFPPSSNTHHLIPLPRHVSMSRRSIPPIIIRSSHTHTPPQPTVPALPDPSPYILVVLATLFVLAWTYTFGLPLELEFLRRRVVRRSMGLLSWWSGSGGGSSGFKIGDLRLNSKTGAAGGRDQRRRGGDVVREGEFQRATCLSIWPSMLIC
jgi:hypothetical protein